MKPNNYLTQTEKNVTQPLARQAVLFAAMLFMALISMVHSNAQTVTYSQSFTTGVAPTTQCTAWDVFRASMPLSGVYSFTISGSNDPVGVTCTDPAIAQAVADALRAGTNYHASSDGQNWMVFIGSCTSSNCSANPTVELTSTGSGCNCLVGYTVRPNISNPNWGAISGNPCSPSSQSIKVVFNAFGFDNGQAQSMTTCVNAPATSIDAMLSTTGDLTGTYTWSVVTPPAHGTLGGFATSPTAAAGTSVSPTGTTYTPDAGYAGPDEFTIQVTDGTYTSMTTVNVLVGPTISAGSDVAICEGSSTTLSATGGVSYSWSPSTALSATTGNSVIAAPAAGTTTIYTVTGTDAHSCVNTATVTVTVNPAPVATFTTTPSTTICAGVNGTYATQAGMTNYTWSVPGVAGTDYHIVAGGTSATDNSVTLNWVTAGSPTVTVTYKDGNGCTSSQASKTVTVNPQPVASFTSEPGANTCTGTDVMYTTQAGEFGYVWIVPGTSGVNYSITSGSIGSTSNTVTMKWLTPATRTVQVNYNDVNGCTSVSSASNTTTVNAQPTIGISPNVAICNGGSTTLTATGGNTYSWTPSTALSATTGASVNANPATGIITYTVTGTEATHSCSNTASVTVTVNAQPTIGISPNVAICNGGSTTLTATGGDTYSWTPSTTLSAATGASVNANPATGTTTYTVTGTENTHGCSNTASVTVTVNVQPTIGISPNVAICNGGSTTLTATGGNTYSWTPSTTLSAATGASVNANPATGIITYTVTGTEATHSCSNTASVTVTVNAQPTIGISPNVAICNGGSTTLTATGGNTYSWTPSTALSATTGASVNANPATGIITYTVTGTEATHSCSNTASVTVTVNAQPTIGISPNVAICNGGSTTLTATGGNTYSWTPSTALSATTGASVNANPATGIITYTVTGTEATHSCSNTASVTVTVNAQPTIGISPNVAICNGGSTTLTATGGNTYSWTPSTALSATTGASVNANPATGIITYTVTGTEATHSCSNTASVTVTVNAQPTIGISPNVAICNGGSTTLTATGGNTYSWTPSTALSATTGASVNAHPATGTTTYTVTGTESTHGCSNTASVTVTVNALPVVSAGSDVAICAGSSTDLTASGAVTYSWAAAADLSASTGATVTATPSATEIYTTTGTDANGCVNTAMVTVTVNPLPTISLGANPAVCPGSTVADLAYTSLTNAAASVDSYMVVWDAAATTVGFADVTDTIPASGTFVLAVPAGAASATYNGNLYVKNSTCTGIASPITVTIIRYDSLLSLSAAVCDNAPLHYPSNSELAGTTYAWSRDTTTGISNAAATGADSVDETLHNTTADPVSVVYTYSLTNTGCTNTEQVTVTVNPTPMLDPVTSPGSICNNSLYVHIPTSATAGTTFTWSRDAIPNITNPAATGADSVHETLENTSADRIPVTYIDTLHANGCINTAAVTVTVNPTPVLVSALTAATCSEALFSYVPVSATAGATFTWSRDSVAGLSNSAASGTDNPGETLVNTTNAPVTTTYVYTLTIDGCTNTQNVVVTVNPMPALSNSIATTAICDSTRFSFVPTSDEAGATFTWVRPFVAGIGSPSGSGADNPNEYLHNTSFADINVTYHYTITAYGCSNTENVMVTVRPNPALSTGSFAGTYCTGTPVSYTPSSNTAFTSFAWARASGIGISPAMGSGSGNIHETLINSTAAPITVVYTYTLTYKTCTNIQYVTAVISPVPGGIAIATMPPADVCSSTLYANFGAAVPPAAGVTYSWSATNATVYATGADKQYSLVNFVSAGTAVVTLSSTSGACTGSSSYTVTVGSGTSAQPAVVYSHGQLVCLQNGLDGYQWGYDAKSNLDSTLIPGAINQSYTSGSLDFSNKYYWVMTSQDGCVKKGYYNMPTGITEIGESTTTDMKVFPNPASNTVNVEISGYHDGNMEVQVMNMVGQQVAIAKAVNGKAQFDVASLPGGMYLIACTRNGQKIATARFVKN